uniref:Peptidase C39-like domain-containing protein n=1 Tax=Phaeomonas parva TaxID=124430 RepID=A0A7S1U2H4_9STRA|mmetsp:Transcript_287/g.747  ORF Transcript_287/g.747 Transcript_287/m.747 type:complete len:374 (+) Transcript_287:94-1215(+)
MSALHLAALVGLTALAAADDECVYPGTCTPPDRAFERVAPLRPRHQWTDDGGYCGSLSIQMIGMTYGTYVSEDVVRKAAAPGGGHGDPKNGYEILHTNIAGALSNLGFAYEQFDYESTPVPQSYAFLGFLKQNLANGSPIVWFIMCKGDAHDCYGLPNATYDHIEATFGIYSDHPLSDATVYPDDVLVHTSDYAPDGELDVGYYRRFDTLIDTVEMDGNCSEAQPGFGKNEMYPCLEENYSFGWAISGVRDANSLPIALSLDNIEEPDTRKDAPPVNFTATLTLSGLEPGSKYGLFRFDVVPADVPKEYSKDNLIMIIKATDAEERVSDPKPFLSNGAVSYRSVLLESSEVSEIDATMRAAMNGQAEGIDAVA